MALAVITCDDSWSAQYSVPGGGATRSSPFNANMINDDEDDDGSEIEMILDLDVYLSDGWLRKI